MKTDIKTTDMVYKIKTFIDDNILNGGIMVILDVAIIASGIWKFIQGDFMTIIKGMIGLAALTGIYGILSGLGMMI